MVKIRGLGDKNEFLTASGRLFSVLTSFDETASRTVFSVTRLGDLLDLGQLLKPLSPNNLPKSPTFLGNFGKGAKIYHFSSEMIFGQLL